MDPLTLTPESMHVAVMCKIIAANGQTLNDDFFTNKLASLDEAVTQYSAVPLSNEIRNEVDNTDDALWTAELGDTGSTGTLVRRTGASSDYYVQVRQKSCGESPVDHRLSLSLGQLHGPSLGP